MATAVNTFSLEEFVRDIGVHADRIVRNGETETVELHSGDALVVMDRNRYRELISQFNELELRDEIESLRRAKGDIIAGRLVPVEVLLASLRQRLGISSST